MLERALGLKLASGAPETFLNSFASTAVGEAMIPGRDTGKVFAFDVFNNGGYRYELMLTWGDMTRACTGALGAIPELMGIVGVRSVSSRWSVQLRRSAST